MTNELITQIAMIMAVSLAAVGLMFWMRERLRDRRYTAERVCRESEERNQHAELEQKRLRLEKERIQRQIQLDEQRAKLEEERLRKQIELDEERAQFEERSRWRQEEREEETRKREAENITRSPGADSGGYIFIELPEQHRPIFHDLLKGFEEYARLKGYEISFSIDSTFASRVAFKFTLKDEGIVVGTARVRRDFQEYVEKVRGGADAFDDLPIITSVEEHELLVTVLKNRISFLQHSYRLSQNAIQFYEGLFGRMSAFPALPAPSVVVQTGGNMDSRSYNANRSQRLIQGDGNVHSDSSTNINIGRSLAERNERVNQLNDLISRLEQLETQDESVRSAGRELSKAKDELEESHEPEVSAVERWLGRAKQLLSTAQVGTEIVEAAKRLFDSFGVSS